MQAHTSFLPLGNSIRRYYPTFLNEATEQEEEDLESMLGVMAALSFHFSIQNGYYCRSVAWVKTKTGENHLVITASRRIGQSTKHAEELMAKTLYAQYQNDETVVNQGSIHIEKMYIDIEPCDGKRYGNKHHCQQFFLAKGREIEVDNKAVRIKIKSKGNIYWNAPLPAETLPTFLRSTDIEREQYILGIDLRDTYKNIKIWNKCYIHVNGEIQAISLSEVFAAHKKEAEVTEEEKEFAEKLISLIQLPDIHYPLSPLTLETIKRLSERQDQTLLYKLVKVIIKEWSLKWLALRPEFTLSDIYAAREIQIYWRKQQEQTRAVQIEKNKLLEKQTVVAKQWLSSPGPSSPAATSTFLSVTRDLSKTQATLTKTMSTTALKQEKKNDAPSEHRGASPALKRLMTGLYKALQSESPVDLLNYLQEIKNHPQYPQLFCYKNQGSFTLLHNIVKHYTTAQLIFYLTALKQAVADKKITSATYVELLLKSTEKGFTPFFEAIKLGDPEKVLVYWIEIQSAIKNGYLTKSDFKDILQQKNVAGFTLLQQALITANPDIVALLFKAIDDAYYIDHILTEDDYRRLLLATNQAKFTLLLEALFVANSDNIVLLLNTIDKAYDNKILTKDDYKCLLMTANEAGFTILHEVFIAANSDNIALLFAVIDKAYSKGILTKADYNHLLMASNKAGFTLMHDAFKSANLQDIKLLFKVIDKVYSQGILSKDDYNGLLTTPNQAGFTISREAFKVGDPDIIKLLFKIINNAYFQGVLSTDDCKKLLASPCRSRCTLLHDALKTANLGSVTLLLTAIDKAYTKGILTAADYRDLLMASNKADFTLVNQALITAQDSVALLLHIIVEAYGKEILTKADYKHLFMVKNKEGFTLVHQALVTARDHVALLFDMANKAYSQGILSRDDYKFLLMIRDRAGFTLMHDAFKSADPGRVVLVFGFIDKAYANKILTKDDYRELLIARNTAGFTLLQQAFVAANRDNITMLFKVIHETYAEGILSKDDYKHLLIASNKSGFTLMHSAMRSGDIQIIKMLVDNIEKPFSAKESHEILTLLLRSKTTTGVTPYCQASLPYAEKMNDFLRELSRDLSRKTYSQGKGKRLHSSEGSTHIKRNWHRDKRQKLSHSAHSYFSSSAQNHLLVATISQKLREGKMALQLQGQTHDLTIEPADTHHDDYIIYPATTEKGQNAYFIEFKKPQKNLINLAGFQLKDKEAMVIINAICSSNTTLILPWHKKCFVVEQEGKVNISGKFTIINADSMSKIKPTTQRYYASSLQRTFFKRTADQINAGQINARSSRTQERKAHTLSKEVPIPNKRPRTLPLH